VPSYGEGYGRKGASAIAVVELATGAVTVLPQWTHVGQVVWAGPDRLVFTQLTGPARGLKYCFQRPSRIVLAALDGRDTTVLLEGVGTARALRMAPDGTRLVRLWPPGYQTARRRSHPAKGRGGAR
jgi:hypothetical protein